MSCSQLAKYLGWISILEPIPCRGSPGAVWPEPQGSKESLRNFTGCLAFCSEWHLGPLRGPSETSSGNELLNLGQLARTCLEPHWPTEEGRVLLSGLPCLKSFPCSISNVLPLPFLSSSPFSHPRAEIRLERLALPGRRARCGAGVLRSRDLEECTVQRKEFP